MMKLLLIFLIVSTSYFAEADFPSCEDILQDADGGGGKSHCYFCHTDRMQEKCKDVCESKGCNPKPNTPGTTSADIIPSSSPKPDPTPSSNNGHTNSANPKKNGGDSGGNNKEERRHGKKKGGRKKGDRKEQHESSHQQQQSAQKQSSSSKSNSNSVVSSSGGDGDGKCNGLDPCVPMDQANAKYMQCCKSKGVMASCVPFCKYDKTKKELMNAFMHGTCDLGEARDVLDCAANHKDNKYCCKAKGVFDNHREICEPFCNPASSQWPTKAEAKYLRCLGEFDTMMKCHYASCRP